MKILNDSFWDEHWNDTCLPQTVNYNFKIEKILAQIFKKYLPYGQNKSEVIEIGCAPGKWLVFFAKEMNYKISGIDFSQNGVEQTFDNLRLTGVSGSIIKDDIFKFQSVKKYDVVFSLGFIEHFNDVDEIIRKHNDILVNSGHLVLGIPNFKGVNYYIQKFIDKSVIDDHNLTIMNKQYLKKIGAELNLEISYLKYIGGFAPTMFVHKSKDNIRKLYGNNNLFKWMLNLFLKLNVLALFNSRFFSSYIVVIYKKTDAFSSKAVAEA